MSARVITSGLFLMILAPRRGAMVLERDKVLCSGLTSPLEEKVKSRLIEGYDVGVKKEGVLKQV